MPVITSKSVCKNEWVTYQHDILQINHMINQFGISAISSYVVLNRLGNDSDKVNKFLKVDLEFWLKQLFLIKDLEKVVDILLQHIQDKKKVCILGDYDVDGMLSSFMLDDFLSRLGVATKVYIPNRLTEYYGPTYKSFEVAKAFNADLCITVDCGSTAQGELAYAKELGLPVIIIDHHLITEVPEVLAIINPKQPHDYSPFGLLCGAGLVFVLIYALSQKLQAQHDIYGMYHYLDLAAIATVCDVMSLVDCNRAIVKLGLNYINHGKTLHAIKQLSQVCGLISGGISSENIAFNLGPHINAAARLGKHELILEFLKTRDAEQAASLAKQLTICNAQRKQIEQDLLTQITATLSYQEPLIFAVGENWHKGVLGTVASKVTHLFCKPSLIMSQIVFPETAEVKIVGSGRSVRGFNLGQVIHKALSLGLLACAGGHELAVGFTLNSSTLQDFKQFLFQEISSFTPVVSSIVVDAILDPISCNFRLWNDLKQLEPCGHGNHLPIFMVPNVSIQQLKIYEKHISCIIVGNSNAKLNGILFKTSAQPELVKVLETVNESQTRLHCIGNFQMQVWKGRNKASFLIMDACYV